MTDTLILAGMGLAFVVIALLADALGVKHKWVSKWPKR